MAYHEEEQTRLKRQSSKQAIALAMEGRWREAVEVNKSLTESFPSDVDAFNRLGRAYIELGEYSLARSAYEGGLEADPYNTIAKKNLNRLSHLGETVVESEAGLDKVEPQQFIEEVGKAEVVNLRRLASPEILAKTVAGGRVNLKIEGQHLVVENSWGEYLGQVETRHGQRLAKLMKGGNEYSAAIINSTDEELTVIIREVSQDRSQAGQPSFPSRGPEPARSSAGDRIGDMIIRRNLEYIEREETLPGDSGYAIVNGNDGGESAEESGGMDDDIDGEE